MAVSVLIATSIRSLGELMQQALGETGQYRADLVDSGEQALKRAQSKRFALAIVDFEIVPEPIDFIASLRGVIPDIRIVAMPGSYEDSQDEIYQSLIDAWLSMPFYLPNLLETLEDVAETPLPQTVAKEQQDRYPFPTSTSKPATSPNPAPEWLQDVNRVAQHLTRLSLGSAAQAALITRGSQLWAYAGQLAQPAAEELGRAVGHYWAHDGGSDLARFIRLDATSSEYMMYATSLGDDYVLALVFETEMPFTEMRTHAGDLARKLSTPPKDDPAGPALVAVSQPESTPNGSESVSRFC